jgi:hypothetical protein
LIKLKNILLEVKNPAMGLLAALSHEIVSGKMVTGGSSIGGSNIFDDIVELKQVTYYFQELRDGKTPRKLSDQQKKIAMAIINVAKKLPKNVQQRLSKQGLTMSVREQSIGFQIPGTPKQKNIGRKTRQEFAKFFNNFEAGSTKTAISSYAEQIMNSDAPDDIKKKASEILNEMEKVAIDIQDELHSRQISDDKAAETLFDYVNSEMDADNSIEFEQLLWYDNQIDSSINSGMIENAVAIMEQLLGQLEFIRGFIIQIFPEISPTGFKR